MSSDTQRQHANEVIDWQPIATAPENVVVLTKIDDDKGVRKEQELKREGRYWLSPDGSIYMYYTPTHWRLMKQ